MKNNGNSRIGMHGEYQRRLRFLERFYFPPRGVRTMKSHAVLWKTKTFYKLYYISRAKVLVPCKYY